jgi:hypothetical protein
MPTFSDRLLAQTRTIPGLKKYIPLSAIALDPRRSFSFRNRTRTRTRTRTRFLLPILFRVLAPSGGWIGLATD